GQAAGSAHQSRPRDHPKIAGRQPAARASVYPRSIARSISHLSATDRRLRPANREDAVGVRARHRPYRKTVTPRSKTKSSRKKKETEERESPSRIRSTYRNLQTLRSGCESDSRIRRKCLAALQ